MPSIRKTLMQRVNQCLGALTRHSRARTPMRQPMHDAAFDAGPTPGMSYGLLVIEPRRGGR